MTTVTPRNANDQGGYVVSGPRSTDAIGKALRGAFGVASLPQDMQIALRKLDELPRL